MLSTTGLLLCGMLTVVYASGGDPSCENCDYASDGMGYLPADYCQNFIQCQPIENGGFIVHEMCCPPKENWNQDMLTCIPSRPGPNCTEGADPDVSCGETTTNLPCRLKEASYNRNIYLEEVNGIWMERPCAPETHFQLENCTCVHGGDVTCDNKIVLFEFTEGDNEWQSSSCNNVQCIKEGNARIEDYALRVDGELDYCHFSILKNWMANNPRSLTFTISLWFYQDESAYNNSMEGIFGNGDCQEETSLGIITYFISGSGHAVGGFIETLGDSAHFGAATGNTREYNAGVWTFVAMVYDEDEVRYYIGEAGDASLTLAETKPANGLIMNSRVASTVGMGHDYNCNLFSFTGYIDDLCITDDAVSESDLGDIFLAGRSYPAMMMIGK